MLHKLLPVNPNSNFASNSNSQVHFYNGSNPNWEKYQIALLAYKPDESNVIRNSFYLQEFGAFQHLQIIDLGDAFALDENEISLLIMEIIQNQVFPLLFGFPQEIVLSICKQWENEFLPHSISWVSSCTNEESAKLYADNIYVKQQYFLGLQRQITNQELLSSSAKNIVPVYLSEYRKSSQIIDSLTRNSELFYFNLNSLRNSDFNASHNPSGFFSEEIISIAKLAGSSDRSLLSIISEMNVSNENSRACGFLVAQMIWYMIEGIALKISDKRNKNGNLSHYVVEIKNSDCHLDFYKSEVSGKWWLQELTESDIQGKLYPCTYDEYLKTVQENIPDRLLELIYH
ncbi:MAG: hypothetical protein ABI851_04635 [Saprospiraceae bacterium]